MTTAPHPFPAKFASRKGCGICSRPIELGMLVMYRTVGGKRILTCGSGECTKSAPVKFCSACGQNLPEDRS